jgi:hypothetical protein
MVSIDILSFKFALEKQGMVSIDAENQRCPIFFGIMRHDSNNNEELSRGIQLWLRQPLG